MRDERPHVWETRIHLIEMVQYEVSGDDLGRLGVLAMAVASPLSLALRPRTSGFELVDLPFISTLLDPPEHTHYRKILGPMFSPAVVKDVSTLRNGPTNPCMGHPMKWSLVS